MKDDPKAFREGRRKEQESIRKQAMKDDPKAFREGRRKE